jgi:hypothetical protein
MVTVEGGELPATSGLGAWSVPTFAIARCEVTWDAWRKVRSWAAANGYDIGTAGAGCASDHPVHSVSWHDALKWCNAKSEMEDLTPVYKVAGEIYRTGASTNIQWDIRHPTRQGCCVAAVGTHTKTANKVRFRTLRTAAIYRIGIRVAMGRRGQPVTGSARRAVRCAEVVPKTWTGVQAMNTLTRKETRHSSPSTTEPRHKSTPPPAKKCEKLWAPPQQDLELLLDPRERLVKLAQRIPWEVFGPHFCPAQNALSSRATSHWRFHQPISTAQ